MLDSSLHGADHQIVHAASNQSKQKIITIINIDLIKCIKIDNKLERIDN